MLAGRKVGSNDVPKSDVTEIPSGKSVDQRGKARDRSREKDPSRLDDSVRFAKGREAIGMLNEMI